MGRENKKGKFSSGPARRGKAQVGQREGEKKKTKTEVKHKQGRLTFSLFLLPFFPFFFPFPASLSAPCFFSASSRLGGQWMLHVGDSLNFPFSFALSKDFSNYSLSSSAMITSLQTQVPHLTLQMQCIRQHCTCSYIYSNPFFILSSKNRPQTTSYNINEGAWGYKTRRARGQ
jgi:hypothetical protein